jgi:membrane protein
MKKLFQKILALVFEVNKQITDGEVRLLANSLAFSSVLSLVPLFAVSLSVFRAFGGLEKLYLDFEPIVMQNLAEAAGKVALENLQSLILHIKPQALGLLGFLGLLLTSTNLLWDMELAVQKVFGSKVHRSITFRIFFSWLIIFLGPLALASVTGLLFADKSAFFFRHKSFLNIGFLFFVVYLICRYVPRLKVYKWPAIISAVFTTVCLVLGQKIFTYLALKIFNYSKLYGSLAAIPIFLLWISILWWIFLIGVALCAALNQRIAAASSPQVP